MRHTRAECANLFLRSKERGNTRADQRKEQSRVAQSAEQPAVNRQVIGSSPIAGAMLQKAPGAQLPGPLAFQDFGSADKSL